MSRTAAKRIPPGAPDWQKAATVSALQQQPVKMVRIMGKQIALFRSRKSVLACDNRCPHEGYPLSEGDLSEDCTLTCNWHNWKFNLETGENLYGGDSLRTYPVSIRENEIWIDIQDPSIEEQRAEIKINLRCAFDDNRYDQIARECARLSLLNAEMLDAARWAIEWSWQRLEFGWTHAYAGMADWLRLYLEHSDDTEIQLSCVLEAVSHASFDVLRQPEFPYTTESLPYNSRELLAAIEHEHEDDAIALAAGGLAAGMKFRDFEPVLSKAALVHYSDFGHSLIYATKLRDLVDLLGDGILRPLLYSFIRSLVFATREDRVPEFRHYGPTLDSWGSGSASGVSASHWYRKSVNRALDVTCAASNLPPQEIYEAMLSALAISTLGFDMTQQDRVRVPVSGNVDWLDFTHGITFANAVRKQCTRFPDLWPAGLLQMACFLGRNTAFTNEEHELERWQVDNIEESIDDFVNQVLSHGQGEHIVSVHLLKTTLAVREETGALHPQTAAILVAALNRFMRSPLKRQNPRRTAYQSLRFVQNFSPTA